MSLSSEIVVVSGLPRSGTSLMMQMLARGGIPALTDEVRTADVDNPRGYFEFERVKKTKEDPSWLPLAHGKAVKMVSALLYDLPPSETYRVIFMRRDLGEILESQEKMLARLGRPSASREQMTSLFSIHLDRLLDWLALQDHMQLLEVSYNDLLGDPEHEAARIARFLDEAAEARPMVAAVDPALYRNRNEAG